MTRAIKVSLEGLALILILVFPGVISAAEFKNDESITIKAEETINDNLFVGGGQVSVEGTVNGDLFVMAREINISGTVNGSVFAIGYKINLTGKVTENVFVGGNIVEINSVVDQDIFAAGQDIAINNYISRDAFLAGSFLELGAEAKVERNLSIAGGINNINGGIGNNLYLNSGEVNLNGTVGSNLEGKVNQLKLLPNAVISGDLNYQSPKVATIDDEASVVGKKSWTKIEDSQKDSIKEKKSSLFSQGYGFKLWTSLSLILLGFIVTAIFKNKTRVVADYLRQNYLRSFGYGMLIVVIAPVVMLVLLFTLVGIPAIFFFIAGLYVMTVLAKIFLGICLGDYILQNTKKDKAERKSPSIYAVYFLGIIILMLINLLPILGSIIIWLGVVAALGSQFILLKEKIIKG